MDESLVQRLARIERDQRRILELLTSKYNREFIPEAEAEKIIGRSKRWLKEQRNGAKGMPATLIRGVDWRYVNGRTPEYKSASIHKLKELLIQKTA